MTPKEFEAALRGRLGLNAPLQSPSRIDLARLMQLYPDMNPHHDSC